MYPISKIFKALHYLDENQAAKHFKLRWRTPSYSEIKFGCLDKDPRYKEWLGLDVTFKDHLVINHSYTIRTLT